MIMGMATGAGRRAAVAALTLGGTVALVATAAAHPAPAVPVDRRVALTGDPTCILGSALPAGTEPAPVPPPEPAPAVTGTGTTTQFRPGPQTVELMVQPDAGMAQRVQALVGVAVQEEYGGRLLRLRVDGEAWHRVQRRIDYLPGVWGESVGSGPIIEGSEPSDPDAATRQLLDRAAESAANLRAECDRKLREATLAVATGGRSCPTRAEMAERRRKAAVTADLLRRVVDDRLLGFEVASTQDSVTVLVTAPGTDASSLRRAAGVAPSGAPGGDVRFALPRKGLLPRVLAIAGAPGVQRVMLDPDAPGQAGVHSGFTNLVDSTGEPAPHGCPADGR